MSTKVLSWTAVAIISWMRILFGVIALGFKGENDAKSLWGGFR